MFLLVFCDVTSNGFPRAMASRVGWKTSYLLFSSFMRQYLENGMGCFQTNKLASAKCQFIRIGLRKWNPAKYSLNGSTVPKSTVFTDLGIRIDSRLSFSDHVDHIVSKAKLRASQILRCFVSKDVRILTRAFITYVRPLLEYCSPVWSPCSVTVTAINKLESVQRTFTKRLTGMSSMNYVDRLKLLGLERLELRRLQTTL